MPGVRLRRGAIRGSDQAAQSAEVAEGFRTLDLAALMFASIAIGIAVSVIMTGVGTSPWVIMAACTFAYSGTGELAYASVIASGGGIVPAVAASLLVSSRFGLLATSMMNRWPASTLERVGIAHVASEPAVAAAIEAGTRSPRAARRAFWQLAIWMAVGWIVGSALGLLLGNVVGDTRRFGLDAVFPASFVGAVVSAFRRQDSAVAVVVGAMVALALTPFMPAGAPILVAAVAALLALLLPPRPISIGRRRAVVAEARRGPPRGSGAAQGAGR